VNVPRPAIAGLWVLDSHNAHVAFDTMVVHRATATSTIAKPAIITFTPDPTPALFKQLRQFEELFPFRRFMKSSVEDVTPRQDVAPNHSKLLSWMSTFGWEGLPEDLQFNETIDSVPDNNPLNLDNLQFLPLTYFFRLSTADFSGN
jgi:hypothetical protein